MYPDASDVTVTNCNDSGPGSLRDALAQAPPGTMFWAVDLTQLSCSTISLESGALGVSANAEFSELFGPPYSYLDGKPAPTLTIDGNGSDRVFVNVYRQNRLDLHNLRVVNGRFVGSGTVAASRAVGGCIYSAGFLALYESVVTGCRIVGDNVSMGGGIYGQSGMELEGSEVSYNLAALSSSGFTYGGGIFSAASSTIERSWIAYNIASGVGYGGGLAALDNILIGSSTISGNTAVYAAGISFFNSNVGTYSDIYQSTITGNQAASGAGAIESWQSLAIRGSTIAFNSSPSSTLAGGIELRNSALSLESSIVAENGLSDVGGTGVVTGNNNLVTASTLALPSDTIMLNPELQPLADNGGLTMTMALSLGSPAIDAGDCFGTPPPYDQRIVQFDDHGNVIGQFQRIVGPCEDIGAFEYGAGDIFANGFD